MKTKPITIGWFLASRQIRRASRWTTVLIIFVMTLTFLNLVVISGLLVGLIEGSVAAYLKYYTGSVVIRKLDKKDYIENSPFVVENIRALPEVEDLTARYVQGGTLEAGYKNKAKDTDVDSAGVTIAGIDPVAENNVTNISKFIVEGEYLESNDVDEILVGSLLIKRYLPIESPGFSQLEEVYPGAKVRIKIGDIIREVTVKGILKTKVDDVSAKVFMTDTQFRALIGRNDYNVDEIAVKLKEGASPDVVKEALLRSGVGEFAKVQTFEDAQPKFLKDIKDTFRLLGNIISSIGLAVASITVFIVIFINAITRRKFIGIMKGIGISGATIEWSYVFQSCFYAIIGSLIGLIFLYSFLMPYVDAHPIDFPFSDGILVAPPVETFFRVLLLIVTTIIAGYIPARMIVRKNTLDSILGRQN